MALCGVVSWVVEVEDFGLTAYEDHVAPVFGEALSGGDGDWGGHVGDAGGGRPDDGDIWVAAELWELSVVVLEHAKGKGKACRRLLVQHGRLLSGACRRTP